MNSPFLSELFHKYDFHLTFCHFHPFLAQLFTVPCTLSWLRTARFLANFLRGAENCKVTSTTFMTPRFSLTESSLSCKQYLCSSHTDHMFSNWWLYRMKTTCVHTQAIWSVHKQYTNAAHKILQITAITVKQWQSPFNMHYYWCCRLHNTHDDDDDGGDDDDDVWCTMLCDMHI